MPRTSFAPLRRPAETTGADDLTDLAVPFANPGALRMLTFVPDGMAAGAPLVVVLHGCTQTAAGYDRAAGWSALATAHGFALLFPEQVRANNPNLCFTWFEGGDTRRGHGEAASIANAVAAVVAAHRLDPTRVFVTGLSAGGAMANVMLASYPDVFAGGAIIAGLPFGVAEGVGPALSAMTSPAALTALAHGDRVRAASSFTGPWPVVSVWHGGADRTVSRLNGAAIAEQWADVHGATATRGEGGRTVWHNAAGVAVVEFTEIDGMGHGTPIDSRDGGIAAPFMLDVGIASSAHILAFWGLSATRAKAKPRSRAAPSPVAPSVAPRKASARVVPGNVAPARLDIGKLDVGKLIGDTLRAAGLMK